MSFLIMSWAAFLVGTAVLAFFVTKRIHGATAPQISAMLLPPIALILASLFSPNLTGFKLGTQGFEFNLQTAKAAATAAVEQQPQIAEAITARKGDEAVAAAKARILAADSWGDLERVMSFEVKDNAFVFYPKVNESPTAVRVKPPSPASRLDRYSVEVLKRAQPERP